VDERNASEPRRSRTRVAPPKLSWVSVCVIPAVHLLAAGAAFYLAFIHFSWLTLGLALAWLVFCGLSITAGYHRLFAHPTYRAAWPVRAFFLLFGAASLQNAAIKWSADHRRHHSETDAAGDPYNARRGFWWAHLMWNFFLDPAPIDDARVADLQRDPLVRFQARTYLAQALLGAAAIPAALGCLWGDPLGAVLCAGFLRIAVQWHFTWSINSVAHMIGKQPYSRSTSARDSWVTAMVTFGEGYHNYHHRFPGDYRNGVRWYQFDPSKWLVWFLAKLGLARDLRRMSDGAVARARRVAAGRASEPQTLAASAACAERVESEARE